MHPHMYPTGWAEAERRPSYRDTAQEQETIGVGSSDDTLMRLAADGRRAAFACLYRRHAPMVQRLTRHYLADPELARDATQDTFLALFLSLPRYEPRGRLTGYLRCIALNQCRMHVRKRREVPVATLTADCGDDAGAGETASASHLDLRDALASLPTPLREVVDLYYGSQLSVEVVAALIDAPVGTVKRRLHDARRVLGERLRT